MPVFYVINIYDRSSALIFNESKLILMLTFDNIYLNIIGLKVPSP